jgi:preprotein translocase SecE subunit
MFMSVKKYIQNSVRELHNVSWPTRNQAIRITTIVFLFMIISAALLGLVDQLLTIAYRTLLTF